MEYIIIGSLVIIFVFVLKFIFKYNKKKIENLGKNDELDKLSNKYPENIEMAKEYLKMLKNENVEIQEDSNSESSLYIAITNKIIIGNIRKSYTRIQTIAHECLHSIQDRRLLIFNFIFSNIYIIYFVAICILGILKMLENKLMFLSILIFLEFIYTVVRLYLENDAMIKAPYLAEKYMRQSEISSEDEIEKITNEFERINKVGIKCTNYYFLGMATFKILIFCIICILR